MVIGFIMSEWLYQSQLGKAFLKFKNAHHKAVKCDTECEFQDADLGSAKLKRSEEYWFECYKAEKDFIDLLENS